MPQALMVLGSIVIGTVIMLGIATLLSSWDGCDPFEDIGHCE